MVTNPNTEKQYQSVVDECIELFEKKMHDYGTSWRILRPVALTDQLFIKAMRTRTIQENGMTLVNEGQEPEFIGLINYSALALVQLELDSNAPIELEHSTALKLYMNELAETKALMLQKNHDYGEAWRDMRVESLTDLILQKLHRIKQIEDNKGKTLVSEGIDAGYRDIINYAAFALIKLKNL
jgi:hypothetical protein